MADTLRLSLRAWLTILLVRDACKGREVALMGLTDPDDPLFVTDAILVKHTGSYAYVEFDDDALFEYTKWMHDEYGYFPDQSRRIWIHTHPGSNPTPSATDWTTLKTHFAGSDWAVMLIVDMDGKTSCHMQMKTLMDNHQQSRQAEIVATFQMRVEVVGPTHLDKNVTGGQIEILRRTLATIDMEQLEAEIKECCLTKTYNTYQDYSSPRGLVPYSRGEGAGTVGRVGFHGPAQDPLPLEVVERAAQAKAQARQRREAEEAKMRCGDMTMEEIAMVDARIPWVDIFKARGGEASLTENELKELVFRYDLTDNQIRFALTRKGDSLVYWLRSLEAEYQAEWEQQVAKYTALAKWEDEELKALEAQIEANKDEEINPYA